jgi:hypothetical protein
LLSLVAVSAGTSLLCWFPSSRRFSLRSLFIATTFLAVVLGMVAWLDAIAKGSGVNQSIVNRFVIEERGISLENAAKLCA